MFDKPACRSAWAKARSKVLKVPALDLAHRLLAAAAAELDGQGKFPAWYRCAIDIKGQRWVYPDAERETLRFDRWHRQAPGFRLLPPFEPPVVPVAAEYALIYLNAVGEPLAAPRDKVLIRLEPILPIRVDVGQRY